MIKYKHLGISYIKAIRLCGVYIINLDYKEKQQ